MARNHRARTTHLSFAENERENRNIQVDHPNSQDSPSIGSYKILHALQKFRRMILLPLAMKGKLRIQLSWNNLTGNAKNLFHDRAKIRQKPVIHVSDWQQVQSFHRLPSSRKFFGLLLSVHPRPSVFLQLVVQRDPVDVERFCSTALVTPTLLDHAQDVRTFDVSQGFARPIGSGDALWLKNEILFLQLGLLPNNHCALYCILKLAHVSQPGLLLQKIHCRW